MCVQGSNHIIFTVFTFISQQLHGKLEKHGLPDFKLRWIQTDGQTFHKEQERKKEKGTRVFVFLFFLFK